MISNSAVSSAKLQVFGSQAEISSAKIEGEAAHATHSRHATHASDSDATTTTIDASHMFLGEIEATTSPSVPGSSTQSKEQSEMFAK